MKYMHAKKMNILMLHHYLCVITSHISGRALATIARAYMLHVHIKSIHEFLLVELDMD